MMPRTVMASWISLMENRLFSNLEEEKLREYEIFSAIISVKPVVT
jgi:hypothetical protein